MRRADGKRVNRPGRTPPRICGQSKSVWLRPANRPTDSWTCQHPSVAYPPFALECGPNETPFRGYFEVPRASAPVAEFFRLPLPNDMPSPPTGRLATPWLASRR